MADKPGTMMRLFLIVFLIGAAFCGASGQQLKLFWQSGQKKHCLEIIPDKIIEFSPGGTSSFKALNKTIDGHIINSKHGYKIWKITQTGARSAIAKGRMPEKYKGHVSHLFKDRSKRLRALPGGIIVYFDTTWDRKKINTWAAKRGVTIIRQFSSYYNSYLIGSEPGIKTLDLSNKLNSEKGVIKSIPNWWKQSGQR